MIPETVEASLQLGARLLEFGPEDAVVRRLTAVREEQLGKIAGADTPGKPAS